MSSDVRFTIKLKVEGREQVVDAEASVDDLREAIEDVREAVGSGKGWETLMLGARSAMEVLESVRGAVDGLADDYESWETAMAKVNTMAGRNASGLAALSRQVRELGHEIPKTKEELADGLYQVISNGVPEADWLPFLERSAKASVGGIADLGETVKVTSTVIKNYGMSWNQAGEVQDKIQMTAKNGVTSFAELASALPRVTANASTLGVSIDELLATFATLTGVSGNTAEVSTQLAAVFTALVKPSGEAVEMAKAMGVEFDAAAIKAAGGMQRFLQQLDQSVKAYASAHGMLEQEIYGRLFGSAESLRALGPLTGELSSKFSENVSAMAGAAGVATEAFSTMSETGASRMQLLKNSIRDVFEPLGIMASACRPAVDGLVSIGQAGLGVWAVVRSVRELRATHVLATASTIAHSVATKTLGAVSAATGVSVTTLKVAIRGLMITTGVGAAIAALTFVIEKLMSSSDDAAGSLDEMSRAEQDAAAAAEAERAEVERNTAQMHQHIAICKNFKGTKEEEKKIVDMLNNTYGATMGYFSSVSAWYQTLIANSKAYAEQMIIEARARQIANQIAKLYAEEYDIRFNPDGTTKRYSKEPTQYKQTTHTGNSVWGPYQWTTVDPIPESSPWHQASARLGEIATERANAKNQLTNLRASIPAMPVHGSPTPPRGNYVGSVSHGTGHNTNHGSNSTTTTTDNTPKLTEEPLTYKQLTENVRYYQAALENADITKEEEYKQLIKNKAAAEEAVDVYNRMVEGIIDLDKYDKDASSIEDMQTNVEVLHRQLSRTKPNTEEWQKVTDAINEWQDKIEGIEKGSMSSIERTISRIDEELKNRNLDMDAEVKLSTTRYNLQRQLDERSKNVTFKVEIEGREGNMSEIDKAIQFYTDRQQTEDADQIRKTQDIVDRLTKKKGVFELSIDLAGKSNEIRAIEELTRKERKLEIRGIGFEELTSRIKELNKLLADTKNPVTEDQRKEINRIIGVYKDWRKQSLGTFDTLKDGWGAVKGIGGGIKSMTDALKGNSDAWSKATAIVDSFISIYEGVQGVIKIIKMLTSLSEAHAAAKLVEAGSVGTEAAIEVAAHGATAPIATAETLAAKVETAEYMELAAAKYLAAHAYIPFAGYGIGAGFALAALALVKGMGAVGAFAEGGIAFGPTLGLFGEYPGASHNPEVVAPLDRLRSLVAPESVTDGKVEFVISGRVLRGILRKEETHLERS